MMASIGGVTLAGTLTGLQGYYKGPARFCHGRAVADSIRSLGFSLCNVGKWILKDMKS